MRILFLLMMVGLAVAEDTSPTVEQLQVQLKAANERILQLEERIKLMTLQNQGAIQFFQAGQALCELDKREHPNSRDDHK